MTNAPGASEERRHNNDHNEYFNAQFGAKPTYIGPGETYCGSAAGEMVVATIASGIGVSIYDKDLQVGGLAYVLLPDDMVDAFPHFDACHPDMVKAAAQSIDSCISGLKNLGAGKNRIRIRLTGGTSLPNDNLDRGTKNYIFVKEYLARRGLVIMSEDLSGPYIRRVHFFPSSGRSVRRILRRQGDYVDMHENEIQYQDNFKSDFKSN